MQTLRHIQESYTQKQGSGLLQENCRKQDMPSQRCRQEKGAINQSILSAVATDLYHVGGSQVASQKENLFLPFLFDKWANEGCLEAEATKATKGMW